MGIQRREFLKIGTAAAVSLIPQISLAETETCHTDYNNTFGVLVDTTVCIGCRKCESACNEQNKLTTLDNRHFEDKSVFAEKRRPSENAFTVVNAFDNHQDVHGLSYLKVQCLHCNDPACVSACIVGALSKCEHGPVTYDASKCIGCRYCMVACPFQIPAYEYHNALDPRVMKCTFCTERVHDGQRPACVEACPEEAMTFGKRGDLITLAHSKIKKHPERYVDHVYGEHEVGGTSWMYLASVDFKETCLPQLSGEPIPEKTENIQHGIFKYFMPPLALYGLLGLVMHSLRSDPDREEVSE